MLVRYNFRIEAVLAGLLHTLYSHRPQRLSGAAGVGEISQLLGGYGSPVEKRVRAYSMRGQQGRGLPSLLDGRFALSLFDAEIVAIAAANEVDMYLSGEYRYTQRDKPGHEDAPGLLPEMTLILQVCQTLGVAGLAATLAHELQLPNTLSPILKTIPVISYRITAGEFRPMRCESSLPSDFVGIATALQPIH